MVEINKKPTTVSSRGFLSKVALRATRPSGVVLYDYYLGYDYLQRGQIHCGENKTSKSPGQARKKAFALFSIPESYSHTSSDASALPKVFKRPTKGKWKKLG